MTKVSKCYKVRSVCCLLQRVTGGLAGEVTVVTFRSYPQSMWEQRRELLSLSGVITENIPFRQIKIYKFRPIFSSKQWQF